MSHTRQHLGQRGEALAAEALSARGFEIVARNWRCPEGEVDLVARRHGAWYFIEVRTRRSEAVAPEESLTDNKRSRMERVACAYLGQHGGPDPVWHLSFVGVAFDRAGRALRLTFYPDADEVAIELWPSALDGSARDQFDAR